MPVWRARALSGVLALGLLGGCAVPLAPVAPPAGQPAAPPAPAPDSVNRSGYPKPETALAQTDLEPDTAIRWGRLPNGLFWAVRPNGTPQGTAEIRLAFDAGSLDEADDERGFAHYVEHMAFNGSTRVAEGEMIPLLERAGLAFGADTNASTGFEHTIYQLRLPRTDPELLDTSLMLMREVASELNFDPQAVERERGVLLAERRDRANYQLEDALDRYRFETPDARYVDRWAGGTVETLTAADAAELRDFWASHYRPGNAAVIVVGDLDPDAVEAAIAEYFGNWQPAAPPPEPRDYGAVDFARPASESIHLHPALSERFTAFALAPAENAPDTAEERRATILRQIGYDAINRRLTRLARQANAPFKSAGFGTGNVFRDARITRLIVDSVDGRWNDGLKAAAAEYRSAIERGFSEAEIAEQLAELDERYEAAAVSEPTRTNDFMVDRILRWVGEGRVPTTGPEAAERYFAMRDEITPDAVLAAMREEAVPLDDTAHIRFRGRTAPEGAEQGLREAWTDAMQAPLAEEVAVERVPFAYTDFGTPGRVVSDTREPLFDVRTVRFANNVRLNVKQTDLARNQVLVRMTIPGGKLLETREAPNAVELASRIPASGLGEHDADTLESILAGRRVGFDFGAGSDAFLSTGSTRAEDLELQLQLMAALITDPGWRTEPMTRFRNALPDYFARLRATPGSALASGRGGVISDGDPRFTQQEIGDYRALDFERLQPVIDPSLESGPIEIAIVGDVDEDRAVELVGRTLGALPMRETEFTPNPQALERGFTDRRGPVVLRHEGEPTQALIEMIWPTTDDSDAVQEIRMELLERVARIAVTDELRERLGQAYSPQVSNSMSKIWPGWGTFSIRAQVELAQLPAARAALAATVESLRSEPIPDDLVERARAPLISAYENLLKSNAGWLAIADRAQSEGDRLERIANARDRAAAVTAAQLQEEAREWLAPGQAVEFLVVPEDAPSPAP
ncbi:MAG: peptidase M16 [Croceicoccus sp.]|nr:peptidase M16 [Croceicoccus sp.]|tara:strand:- start:2524 stop:5445 length:2922 start_codon:yes stop_codon:yes gene_type:complete